MTKKISHHLANGDEVASDHPWVTDDAITGNNAINQILEKHEILVTHAHLMSGSL
jgi:signal recognition particle GTPase